MKIAKYLSILVIPLFIILSLRVNAQDVTQYNYVLESGIKVNTTHGWNFLRVNQNMNSLESGEETGLSLSFIDVGDLVSGNALLQITSMNGDTLFTLEEKKDYYTLEPGTYNGFCKLSLDDNSGSVSFYISGIEVKETKKTNCTVFLNDVQVIIEKEADVKGGLGTYRTIAMASKDAEEGGPVAYPSIYNPDNHSQELSPVESPNDVTHRIQPGIYDLFVDVDISWAGYKYQIWLENIEIEKDIRKIFRLNLNGSKITVNCEEECPEIIHFYPVGTAETIGLKEDKSLEKYSIESPKGKNICPPGSYDILLNYGYGERYEWRENVNCKYGELTVIDVE